MWKSNGLYRASGSADMTLGMLKLSCLCGQVRIEIRKRPDFINECNCTLCSKSGARWAYFHPSEVSVVGTTKGYSREDKEDPAAEIRFCANCGSTTHFIFYFDRKRRIKVREQRKRATRPTLTVAYCPRLVT